MKNFKKITSAVALICLICISLLCFAGCGDDYEDIATESDKNEELSMLEFELWRNGKAVNPELYILF